MQQGNKTRKSSFRINARSSALVLPFDERRVLDSIFATVCLVEVSERHNTGS
jgi:hypothetical protein